MKIRAKDNNFYELFVDTADKTCEAARLLYDLMTDYTNVETKIDSIEKIEHECDQKVHNIMKVLNKTFITPIDREDIYYIAKEMDNITDSIEATAHRFNMFNVKTVSEDAKKMGKLIIECTTELKNVMLELKSMNKSEQLSKNVIEVNRIEDYGDTIFRKAVQDLFLPDKYKPVEIIIWKEIYDFLENTLDACEDVANVVEGIVMKNA